MVAVAALLLTGLAFSSCTEANAENDVTSGEISKVESVELLKTSQSWDGAELPDYLDGKPELCVLKVTVPPHCSLSKHHHDVMSYGIVNKGELTLIRESDKKEKTVRQGEAVVETVGTVTTERTAATRP